MLSLSPSQRQGSVSKWLSFFWLWLLIPGFGCIYQVSNTKPDREESVSKLVSLNPGLMHCSRFFTVWVTREGHHGKRIIIKFHMVTSYICNMLNWQIQWKQIKRNISSPCSQERIPVKIKRTSLIPVQISNYFVFDVFTDLKKQTNKQNSYVLWNMIDTMLGGRKNLI